MFRRVCSALSAAAAVAALGLSGCSTSEPTTSPASAPPPASGAAGAPTTALPSPDALIDVLSQLADPNVPGINKVNLVEGANPQSAATLDNFINALRDNGYLPMTFSAKNVAWSDKNPADVAATVSVNTARGSSGAFTFPMEFAPFQGGWQLSKRTGEMLLALSNSPVPSAPAPGPTSAPAPPSTPPAPPSSTPPG